MLEFLKSVMHILTIMCTLKVIRPNYLRKIIFFHEIKLFVLESTDFRSASGKYFCKFFYLFFLGWEYNQFSSHVSKLAIISHSNLFIYEFWAKNNYLESNFCVKNQKCLDGALEFLAEDCLNVIGLWYGMWKIFLSACISININ